MNGTMPTVAELLRQIPTETRPTVLAARRMVRAIAPDADEIAYNMRRPRSDRMMWKLVRYAVDGENVLSIGTYPTYATMFFYRGRELEDSSGLLEGSGKDLRFTRLRSPADLTRPALKRLVRNAFAR